MNDFHYWCPSDSLQGCTVTISVRVQYKEWWGVRDWLQKLDPMHLWKQVSSLSVALYSVSDVLSVVRRASAGSREGKMGMQEKKAKTNGNLHKAVGSHGNGLEATFDDDGVLQKIWCHYLWSYTWIWPKCPRSWMRRLQRSWWSCQPICDHWNGNSFRRRVSRDWGTGCIFMSMSEPADLQQHSGAATHIVPLRCNSRLAPTDCSYLPLCWFSLPWWQVTNLLTPTVQESSSQAPEATWP